MNGQQFKSSTPSYTMKSRNKQPRETRRGRDSLSRNLIDNWMKRRERRMMRGKKVNFMKISKTSTLGCWRREKKRSWKKWERKFRLKRSQGINSWWKRSWERGRKRRKRWRWKLTWWGGCRMKWIWKDRFFWRRRSRRGSICKRCWWRMRNRSKRAWKKEKERDKKILELRKNTQEC